MCNLYRMTRTANEVAHLFDVIEGAPSNAGGEIYPGYPGMVIAGGKVETMTWGFPLAMKSKRTGEPLKPKPVNNARTDKLSSPFWRSSFVNRRCLIPLEAFAEAEGPKGGKTRTWISMPDREVFCAAGVWRPSEEWGDCYAMIITDASAAMQGVHHRMPVLLHEQDQATWLAGEPKEAFALCRPYTGELALDRTAAPWVGGAVQSQLL